MPLRSGRVSDNFTAAELCDMILTYGECHQNAALTLRTYRERYGATRRCPTSVRTIYQAVQRVRENMPIQPITHEGVAPRRVAVMLEERVLDHFHRNPTCSLRQAGRYFEVSHWTVHSILKKHKVHPFKFKKMHGLLPRDKPVRECFCRWMLEKIEEEEGFLSNIIWTDESTFTRNGMWNRQNCRHWAEDNPRLFRESGHQYRFSVNVWAAIHGHTIIGPIFIDGNLNADKFIRMLNGEISDYLDELSLAAYRRVWYQLDGAPAHSTLAVKDRLTEMFGQRWMGRNGPRRWPPRSPDLTPLDFFLWGFIKGEVYKTPCDTANEMIARIILAFNKLKSKMDNPQDNLAGRVNNNIIKRCMRCIEQGGGHFENLKI